MAVRDEILIPADISKWRIGNMLPHLSFAWWLVVTLVLVIVWLFEASYKLSKDTSPQLTPLETEALVLAESFQKFIASLGDFPAFEPEVGDCTVATTALSDEQWWRIASCWEKEASRQYMFKFAPVLNDVVFRFGEIGIHEPHLDQLQSAPLPREEFIQVPDFLRFLVMRNLAKRGFVNP